MGATPLFQNIGPGPPFPGSAKPIGKRRRYRFGPSCRCLCPDFPFHVPNPLSLFICTAILSEQVPGIQANHMKLFLD